MDNFDWRGLWEQAQPLGERINKKKVAADLLTAAARFGVRSALGPRKGAPIEDMVDSISGAAKRALGVAGQGYLAPSSTDAINYSPVSQEVADWYWSEVAKREWCICLLIGVMGSGKSAVCAFLAELLENAQSRPSLWLNTNQAALDTLGLSATAIEFEDLVRLMAVDGAISDRTIILEDTGRSFNQYSSASAPTQTFQDFMAVRVRKFNNWLIINGQSSAIIQKHIIPTMCLCKRSHMSARDEERGGQAARSRRADHAFDLLNDPDEECKYVWVEDPALRFRGLVRVPLSSGWSERFSKAAT